jgi:hypothetical protein
MLFDIKSAVNDIVVLKEHPREMRGMIKETVCYSIRRPSS